MTGDVRLVINTGVMSVQPKKSKVVVRDVGDSVEWVIPAKKGINFMMVFGLFFGGIPLLIGCFLVYASLFGTVVSGSQTASGSLMALVAGAVFLSVFVLIGFGLAYFGYKVSRTSYKVSVRGGAVEVTDIFRGKEKSERVEAGDVYGVGLYKSSTTNNKANYGVFVRAIEGKGIQFFTGVKEDEQRWLASEMMTVLSRQGGLRDPAEMAKSYFSSGSEGGSDASQEGDFSTGALRLYHEEGGQFVIEKNTSKTGLKMALGSFGALLFGGIFAGVGFLADDGDVIFAITGSVMMLVAFGVFIYGLTRLGTRETFTFEEDRILKEKFRKGVSQAKIRFPKADFQTLIVKSSGSSNGEERYSVTLKGSKEKLTLFSWVEGEVSEVVKYKVNGWLKPEEPVTDKKRSSDEGYGGYGEAMRVERPEDAVNVSAEIYQPDDVPVYNGQTDISDVKGGIWAIRAFISLFLLVGLGVLIFGVLNYIKAKDSETWEKVKGVVISSEISKSSSDGGTTYGADVIYRYRVNKKKYKGDDVTVSEVSTSSYSRAQQIVARYPKRKKVAVYYDPDDPSDSVLERGVSGANWFLPLFGLGFIIIPGGMLFCIERSHRKQKLKNGG